MSEIEVKHLTKTFEQKGLHVEALKDINLTIEAGDIYGIIGMSGAGKSTLVRCLNYLERPTEGQVLIEGKDLGNLSEKELRKQRSESADAEKCDRQYLFPTSDPGSWQEGSEGKGQRAFENSRS